MSSTRIELPYIPNPFSNTPLVLDLEFLGQAEAREHEIAFSSPTKAPELMALFAVTISKLADLLPKVHFQHRLAEKRARERRAVVIIEVVPAKMELAGKKLSQNAETREAIIDLDELYSAAVEKEMVIEATLILLKEKLYSMKNNLATVQKIYEQTQSFMYRQNTNLIAGMPELDRPRNAPEQIDGVTIHCEHNLNTELRPNLDTGVTQPPMRVGKARY